MVIVKIKKGSGPIIHLSSPFVGWAKESSFFNKFYLNRDWGFNYTSGKNLIINSLTEMSGVTPTWDKKIQVRLLKTGHDPGRRQVCFWHLPTVV